MNWDWQIPPRGPWSLFNEADAQKSLATMSTCLALAVRFFNFYHPVAETSLDQQPQ